MTYPGRIWNPRTEQGLIDAAQNGLLTETHTLDLKRELESGDSANKRMAKDVAAFSLDGGTIVIGVDEDTSPPSLNPVVLEGLPERIEQIAGMRVDELVFVETVVIESAADTSRGHVLVHVPASPRAPHMADGKYYGRGDKTNRILPDAEIRRLHEKQTTEQRNILADARAVVDELTADLVGDPPSLLVLLAQPLGAPDDLLVPLASSLDWSSIVRELIQAAVVPDRQKIPPSFGSYYDLVRRPGAVAATIGMSDGRRFDGDHDRVAELLFHETGLITLASARAVATPPISDGQRTVLEELILGHADLMVRLAAQVAQRFGFSGSWRFGLAVTNLKGAVSYALVSPSLYHKGPEYTRDLYESATTASLLELMQLPEQAIRQLVSSLLRSLNSHELFPWLRE